MSAAHTPAPWKVVIDFKCTDGDLVPGVVGKTGGAVAWANGRTDAESLSNARLIAAAPDLLEALIALHAVAHVTRDEDYAAVTLAAEVIARATGATP